MRLEYLTEFTELCRCLNFSQAARNLHLSQSTLTRHIARLERDAGLPLLARTTRSVKLTESGRMLLERIAPLACAYEEALADVRASYLQGAELRIAYPYYFATRYLHPALDRYAKKYPQVTPLLSPIQPQDAEELILSGACDITFEIVYPGTMPDVRFQGVEIGREPFCICMPETHPLASHATLEPRDLDGQCFVYPASYPTFEHFIDSFCTENGIAPGRVVESKSVELVCPIVLQNSAITLSMAHSGAQAREGICYVPLVGGLEAIVRIVARADCDSAQVLAFFQSLTW